MSNLTNLLSDWTEDATYLNEKSDKNTVNIVDIYNRCGGGKNVFRYSFGSKTEKGMTITADDYVKNKISVAGTATSSSAGVALACRINGEAIPSGGMTMDKDYNLVFTNNSLTNCKAMVVVSTSSGTKYYNSTTGTKTYSIKAGEKITTASVQATSTSSAVSGSVEVMLAPSEIGDLTYTPYAPTNSELYKTIDVLQHSDTTGSIKDCDRVILVADKGKKIPNGTDLDTITERGVWFCSSYSDCNTLYNIPQKNHGFRLEVVNTTANNGTQIIQRLYINADQSEFYMRILSSTNKTWYKYSGTAVSTLNPPASTQSED